MPTGSSYYIAGRALDYVGMDVSASLGDSRLNTGRIIRLFCPARPVLRTLMHYLIAFCTRREPASDVISGVFLKPVVPDKRVKSRDPCLNGSLEIPPEAVVAGIFDSFFRLTFDRK